MNKETSLKYIKQAIQSQHDFDTHHFTILEQANDKEFSVLLNAEILSFLTDSHQTPIKKFLALKLLKEIMTTSKPAIVNVIVNSKNLLSHLAEIAKYDKDNHNEKTKGLHYFGKNEKSDIGVQFVRLTLECIMKWATQFPSDASKKPTKFKVLFEQLIEAGVTFPSHYMFYNDDKSQKVSASQNNKPKNDISTTLKNIINHIKEHGQIVYDTLIDNTQYEEYQQEFLEDAYKHFKVYDHQLNDIVEQTLNQQTPIHQQEQDQMFEYKDFLTIFDQNFDNLKNLQFMNEAYVHFRTTILPQVSRILGKSQPQINKNLVGNKQPLHNQNQNQAKPIKSQQQSNNEKQRPISTNQQNTKNLDQQNRNQSLNKIPTQLSNVMAGANQNRSGQKSFKGLFDNNNKLSMNKDIKILKNLVHVDRAQKFDESFDNLTMSMKSVRGFPAQNVGYLDEKKYAGEIHHFDLTPFQVLYGKLGENEIKRFKKGCIQDKSLVFESQEIQVGIKTKREFNQISNKLMIKFELYIGNKTNQLLETLNVSFSSDYQLILWQHYVQLQSSIQPKQQLYFNYALAYQNVPFDFLECHISYHENEREIHEASCYLPFLLCKFIQFQTSTLTLFRHQWQMKKNLIVKSELIQFNPQLLKSPRAFLKYFDKIIELNSYEEFQKQKSNKSKKIVDYKLGGTFTLQDLNIVMMLKIIMRPNGTGLFKVIPHYKYYSISLEILNNLCWIFGLV